MTCPSFSDRTAATRDMMGPPTAREHLGQSMRGSIEWQVRASTDPEWLKRQLSPPVEVRRFPWLILFVAMIGICFSLAMLGYAYASEPRRQAVVYVIWNETADKQAHVHQFVSPTACNTDLGGVAKTMPDGSRLSCRRISTKGE